MSRLVSSVHGLTLELTAVAKGTDYEWIIYSGIALFSGT